MLTTNLKQLAIAFKSKAKESSTYKRIRRFFKKEFNLLGIGIFCLDQYLNEVSKTNIVRRIYLIIDRVHWKVGKHNHNCLTLLLYDPILGLDFPVAFKNLGHAGNSNLKMRKELIESVLTKIRPLIDDGKIEVTILGDREFTGEEWEEYLDTMPVNYNIRLKRDYKLEDGRSLKEVFRGVGEGRVKEIRGEGYRIIVTRLKKIRGRRDDFLAVMTVDVERGMREILNEYKIRWKIERTFFNLNSNGFNCKDTRLEKAARVEMLMYLLLLAYFLSTVVGVLMERLAEQPVKKHGYKATSIFLYGLRTLLILQKHGPKDEILRKLLDFIDEAFLMIFNLLNLHNKTKTVL